MKPKYYITKADRLLQLLIKEKARAKQDMVDAACITDINKTLMRAGEQTAFDICIKLVDKIYKHNTDLPLKEPNPERSVATEDDQSGVAG